jgi:hypothetical protein
LLRNFMKVTASISRLNQQQVTTIHHPPVKVEGLAFPVLPSLYTQSALHEAALALVIAARKFAVRSERSAKSDDRKWRVAGKQDFNGKRTDARPGIDAPAGKYYLLEMYYWSGS